MRFATITPDGIIELREDASIPAGAYPLTHEQFDALMACQDKPGMMAILSNIPIFGV